MIWRRALAAGITGTIFGAGLAISSMTNPEKVLSFLTLAKGWDPSLLLVMGAAVAVTFVGYRLAWSKQPLFADSHSLPGNSVIDRKLLGGAVMFGMGWGLAGYCPGPAIAALASGSMEPFIVLASMLIGSQIARLVFRGE